MRNELSNLANETEGSNGQLSGPHFDDEATLLSAQRVVPFHKLTDKTNSNWNLLFGATLAAALMIGAVGGVIYARLEGTPVSKDETTERVAEPALQDESVSAGVESHELTTSDETTAIGVEKADQKAANNPRNPSSASKRVSPNPAPAKRVQTDPDESEYYANERELRGEERRAARRTRREATREAQHSDDLFRIREIFEGSPRP
jgi:hypothetical protein